MVLSRMISTSPDLISSIYVITVGEHRSKVAVALSSNVVMVVMVLCTSIERNIFCGIKRKVITA